MKKSVFEVAVPERVFGTDDKWRVVSHMCHIAQVFLHTVLTKSCMHACMQRWDNPHPPQEEEELRDVVEDCCQEPQYIPSTSETSSDTSEPPSPKRACLDGPSEAERACLEVPSEKTATNTNISVSPYT